MRRSIVLFAALGLAAFVAVQVVRGPEPQGPRGGSPSVSPSPTDVGRDIGLGFRVCRVSKLRGLDLLGDGSAGSAWTATTVTDEGKCRRATNDSYLVAVDVTGDGRADASWEALRWCFVCEPYGAVDFDADGDDEFVVLEQGGSVVSFLVFSAAERPDGSVELGPIVVAAPGDPEGKHQPGKPLHFWVGGDEGFSATVGCEGYPEEPVFIVAWSNHPVEGPGSETTEVHVTRLVLRDGAFQVVGASHTEEPTSYSQPEAFPNRAEACGLDLA